MSMIRLQHHTPDIYTRESRDFQLLLRLYDCVINGVEYDITTINSTLDTMLCKSNVIPLLQTKLGFFTKGQYNDEDIRYILAGFKDIIRNKGSLKAIQYLMSLYLKIKNITSPLSAYYITEEKTLSNGFIIPAYSVIIEIRSNFTDTALLEEVLRYILPAGVGYYIYFYQTILEYDNFIYDDNATLLFTSININSRLRGSNQIFNDETNKQLNLNDANFLNKMDNKIIGSINSMIVAPISSSYEPDLISTQSNSSVIRYNAGEDNLFLGIYETDATNKTLDITYFQSLTGNKISDKTYLLFRDTSNTQTHKFDEYIFIGNPLVAVKLKWLGNYASVPDNPNPGDVIYDTTAKIYKVSYNNEWVSKSYPLSLFIKEVIPNESN